jgi:hypothetical protein
MFYYSGNASTTIGDQKFSDSFAKMSLGNIG